MELLSYNSIPCCDLVNLRQKLVKRDSTSYRVKLPVLRKPRIMCARINSRTGSYLGYFKGERSFLKDPHSSQSISSKIFLSRSYEGYVVSGEEDVRITSEKESPSKVFIPGLPDESNGESGAPISSCFWEWKPKLNVHYEKAGCANEKSPALLFLPGFGVGSFHYEKQLKDLGRDYRVWAIDFLGQGMSLPFEDPAPRSKEGNDKPDGGDFAWGFGEKTEPWANELVYSVDLWQDQVRYFIQEQLPFPPLYAGSVVRWHKRPSLTPENRRRLVIGEPVYVVGNSLGGFVALYLAACNPELVKGVTLLNATPFWGFLPNPIRFPGLAKIFPWAGKFPFPSNVRKLTEFVWQKIRDPESIGKILEQVYVDHSTNVDKVFSRILETTQHPAAAASFASIMFAPQGQLSFKEALTRCQGSSLPVCLMYGKEDPWVRPVWGLQVKRQVPEAPYYEISPAGHCPHDEVPEVVNYLLRGWIRSLETQDSVALPLLDDLESIRDSITRELEITRDGSKKSVKVNFYGSKLSIWNLISSFVKSRFQNLQNSILDGLM